LPSNSPQKDSADGVLPLSARKIVATLACGWQLYDIPHRPEMHNTAQPNGLRIECCTLSRPRSRTSTASPKKFRASSWKMQTEQA
jgi:hypothetical protein